MLTPNSPNGLSSTPKVCKTWLDTIDSSKSLQYIIELECHHLVDGPLGNGLGTITRLQALLKHEDRWKFLKFTKENIIHANITSVHALVKSVLGIVDGKSLTFCKLPSESSSHSQMITWKFHNLDTIHHFGMDPDQDLLVLIQHLPNVDSQQLKLHLRTLSSNELHPQAASHEIDFTFDILPACQTQIIDDLVVLFLNPCLTVIVHWKSGTIQSVLKGSVLCPEKVTILSPRLIAITRCYVDVFRRRAAALDVYDISDTDHDADNTLGSNVYPPKHVAILHLPKFMQKDLWSMSVWSDSNPLSRYTPRHGCAAYPNYQSQEETAFAAGRGSLLVLGIALVYTRRVEAVVSSRTSYSGSYNVLVDIDSLLSLDCLRSSPEIDVSSTPSKESSKSVTHVPWSQWAKFTTWLPAKRFAKSGATVQGDRCCTLVDSNAHGTQVEVLDFNRNRIRRAECFSPENMPKHSGIQLERKPALRGEHVGLVDGIDINSIPPIAEQFLERDPIRIPYLESKVTIPFYPDSFEASGVMIDEQGIILYGRVGRLGSLRMIYRIFTL
ncbi:uncharacterized protein EI90DRAFT_3287834 [Cantharellus anzutake]|uniref:uncharacterized protein n=1 Tax=Cantharellus anzutake TaxID=1750568 RepID=UPI00190461FE|nr:uncharacterized protein EI90DRAFT_3287834 [Cantharellus anzutake]KAF8335965.1 hypothetical protein EI90DRAFT_3287834 [Cantharellus anzutake]